MKENQEHSQEDITGLLEAWRNGDDAAHHRVIGLVMDALRAIAQRALRREQGHRPLQTTDLVNEAYLKLVQSPPPKWQSRGRFFGIAARCMRQILVDLARERRAEKRGGPGNDLTLHTDWFFNAEQTLDALALHEALEALEQEEPRKVRVVELRMCGIEVVEIAEILGVAEATVKRDWRHAKMFLYERLSP